MTVERSFRVALALGSNLGDRFDALRRAVDVVKTCVEITAVSRVYETPAAYVKDQPAFLNAAVLGTTKLDPLTLLWNLKSVERKLGRMPTFRYGPRVIDIDILFFCGRVLETPELTIPHPRIEERDFVLYPLNDIVPDWKHPVTQKTVAEMLSALPKSGIECLGKALG